jgi:hypothetical protein
VIEDSLVPRIPIAPPRWNTFAPEPGAVRTARRIGGIFVGLALVIHLTRWVDWEEVVRVERATATP